MSSKVRRKNYVTPDKGRKNEYLTLSGVDRLELALSPLGVSPQELHLTLFPQG